MTVIFHPPFPPGGRVSPPESRADSSMNIRELARRAGISRNTVSLALRNSPRVADSTRRRVQRLAAKLNYRPDPIVAGVMSAIVHGRSSELTPPLVLLSGWPHPHEWQQPDSGLKRVHEGVLSRAGQLGYRVEELWMRAPGMNPRRVEQILASRGTQGIIVFSYPSVPAVLDIDVSPYACAYIGRALVKPRIHSVGQDNFQGMMLCLDRIKQHGYRRPALLLDVYFHEQTMHCWAAAYQFYMSQLPTPIPIWFVSARPKPTSDWLTAGCDVRGFRKWIRRYRPDAVITSHAWMMTFVQAAGFRVPDDLGLAVLYQLSSGDGFAGIDICDEAVASHAVDLVADQIRNNQHGPPPNPQTVLFDGIWRDGPSLPRIAAKNSTGPSHRQSKGH